MKPIANALLVSASMSALTGCAAMFSPRNQEIPIRTDNSADVLFINGGDSVKSGTSVHIRKERKPVQIVVSNGKYRDEQFILMQYSMSPWHILSWVPGLVIAGPVFDKESECAYSFPSSLDLKFLRIPELVKQSDNAKHLKVTSVTADLSNKNITTTNHQYSDWIDDPKTGESQRLNTSEKFTLTNLIANRLNALLEKKGFAGNNLNIGSRSNILNLSGELESIKMHYVNNDITFDKIAYADLAMSWKLGNSSDKTLITHKITVTSGQFIFSFPYIYDPMLDQVIGDGVEKSLFLFLNESDVNAEIYSAVKPIAKTMKAIKLAPAKKYVSTLQQAIKSSVTIKDKDGHGSGFIISSDGYIVTNCHVISHMANGKVVLNDNSEFDYDVVQYDSDIDLALIKIDASGLTPFKLQKTKKFEVTSDVYAVGTPQSTDLAQTVSKGIISGIRSVDPDSKLIQTDASVNPGNSGGALIDPKGLVIGVVSSKIAGFGVEGVAFGIPAYEILERLKVEASY